MSCSTAKASFSGLGSSGHLPVSVHHSLFDVRERRVIKCRLLGSLQVKKILGFADAHGVTLCRGQLRNNAIPEEVTRGIIGTAGELDDRWPGTRKRTGREESPDTTLREQRIPLGRKA